MVENVDCVRQLLECSPIESIFRLSAESNIHRASVQHILRDDLHLFPYKIQSQSQSKHTARVAQSRIIAYSRIVKSKYCIYEFY